MRFPNAHSGVKKLFIAEILTLIVAALGIISGIMLIAAAGAAAAGSAEGALGTGLGAGALGIISGIVAIVAFVIHLVGLNTAAKDEKNFRTAFYCVFVGLGAALLGSIFSGNSVVNSIFNTVANVANLMVTIFVIQGIISLADQLDDEEMKKKGHNLFKIIIGVQLCSILLTILVAIFQSNATMGVIAGIVGIIAAIVQIVGYVLYLMYLKKAEAMLANAIVSPVE